MGHGTKDTLHVDDMLQRLSFLRQFIFPVVAWFWLDHISLDDQNEQVSNHFRHK